MRTLEERAENVAQILVSIEANYLRETSGPGSRFEGQRLEMVQARRVIREVLFEVARGIDAGPDVPLRPSVFSALLREWAELPS